MSVKLLAVCVLFIYFIRSSSSYSPTFTATLGELTLQLDDSASITLSLAFNKEEVLTGVLGRSLPQEISVPTNCGNGEDICIQWSDVAKLTVQNHRPGACYLVTWTTVLSHLEDCFDFSTAHWYGGGETYNQSWPIGDSTKNAAASTTGDTMTDELVFGSLMDPYWVSSNGVVVFASSYDTGVPLFIKYNVLRTKNMCFKAANEYPYYQYTPTADNPLVLHYVLCSEPSIKEAHRLGLKRHLHHPTSTVDLTTLQYPIWSTWAYYKADISQDIVTDFAQTIVTNGFNVSQFEIDDLWESCYGDAAFASSWDPATLLTNLHNLGLRVTFWTHPFVNFECSSSFKIAFENGYLVQDQKNRTQFTSWWDGSLAGIIDFTNEYAVTWWKGRLNDLKTNYGVDGFKFDAGEAGYLPYCGFLKTDIDKQPNSFSTAYATSISENFGTLTEVRTGYRAQHLPLFFRLLDRNSQWDSENGLKSVIPATLTFGLLGYPFVLPDMVGGNAYDEGFPSKELFIRWLEVNVFLPSIQFSIPPWYYDDDTVQITKNMLDLRNQHADRLIAAANQAVEDGTPMVRPLWWFSPFDEVTYTIDTEFTLGDDLLVAPVVEEGATSRDIYLPYGYWQDQLNPSNSPISGPTWLMSYSAGLDQLPHFVLISYTTPEPAGSTSTTIVSTAYVLLATLPFCRMI